MLQSAAEDFNQVLSSLNLDSVVCAGVLPSVYSDALLKHSDIAESVCSPIDSSVLASVSLLNPCDLDSLIHLSSAAAQQWRLVPAPERGELVRLLGEKLRTNKALLAQLLTLECGKTLSESLGEVQEMIDICDFSVGLSRQLYGLTIASERPQHRMMEQWHPLGVVGVITAFNFPVAVWAWNAALALVCGNSIIWKPSEKTPVCALACQCLLNQVLTESAAQFNWPHNLSIVINGKGDVGSALVEHRLCGLISATGSVAMGRSVATKVSARLGRSLLELGGNNAAIITPSANLDLAVRGILFSAVGTAGQRCTSLRRLIAHRDIADELIQRLQNSYGSVRIGDPRQNENLLGPLIDGAAYQLMQDTINTLKKCGAKVLFGGDRVCDQGLDKGFYVKPALVVVDADTPLLQCEVFAPVLYLIRYTELSDAIAWNNSVPQGLSSSIFTSNLQEAELFLSAQGSDCGIANVNIGTSGAEIGGAFGGEKDTGGGRESGSDAWKNYMRRTTNTINYGEDLPLAQGVTFDGAKA